MPTPTASDFKRYDSPADRKRKSPGLTAVSVHFPTTETRFGVYEPAVHKWEQVTRPAPDPTEPNSKGKPRLSARFAEWMMGLPDGWVTSPDIGLTRAQQLKAIGNGVVPQQALFALRVLDSMEEAD